jgi:hypothetical protein
MKVIITTRDEDFLLILRGQLEDISSAGTALTRLVPAHHLHAVDGLLQGDCLLRIDSEAKEYLAAWLRAVEGSYRTKIIWLPTAVSA